MKRIMIICLAAAVCTLLLGACVNRSAENTKTDSSGDPEAAAASEQTATEPIETAPEAAAADIEAEPEATPSATQSPGSPIIAESSNAVSDKEKQQILDDLSEDLEDVLSSLNNLEDFDDSDLDIESF